jgi:hypothetical protein
MSKNFREVRFHSIPSGKHVSFSLSINWIDSRLLSLWIELSKCWLHFPFIINSLRDGRQAQQYGAFSNLKCWKARKHVISILTLTLPGLTTYPVAKILILWNFLQLLQVWTWITKVMKDIWVVLKKLLNVKKINPRSLNLTKNYIAQITYSIVT